MQLVASREVSWNRVEWESSAEDPAVLFSALDGSRYEVRKVEVFRNGISGFAEAFARTRSTQLGSAPLPALDQINAADQFEAEEISLSQFDVAWRDALSDATRGPELFRCRCCGVRGLREPALGSYEICGECGWEDDPVQSSDPHYEGGANGPSLLTQRRHHVEQVIQQRNWQLGNTHGLASLRVIVESTPVEIEAAMDQIATWIARGDSIVYEPAVLNGEAAVRVSRDTD